MFDACTGKLLGARLLSLAKQRLEMNILIDKINAGLFKYWGNLAFFFFRGHSQLSLHDNVKTKSGRWCGRLSFLVLKK
jgi:hypothetical protein